MKYIEFVNSLIKNQVSKQEKLVLFGQNINAGSCLGGLTRGLSVSESSKIINSTNSENSLCGFGFGMMMNGLSSIFFMKQLDFLLLGIDHLVNTYNIIRNTMQDTMASFTIMPIVVDNGYQGPHSSLNNFPDFCSIARISGYTITNKLDAKKIIETQLISPGFRIICVSQRMFKNEVIEPQGVLYSNNESSIFQYSDGKEVTIVCFNFSFPEGWNLMHELKKNGIESSLFNVNSTTDTNWNKIIENVKESKNLIIIDDSKSQNLVCDSLFSDIIQTCTLNKKIILKRQILDNWLNPVSDKMNIDYNEIIKQLTN